MLAELKSWITGLITLIFFATILEMLLPIGQMRRFVRLVIGLVLIMVLMKPVFKVMEFTFAPERVLWNLQQNVVADQTLPTASRAGQQIDELVLATVRDRVRQQVEQSAMGVDGVRSASAKVTFANGTGEGAVKLKEIQVSIVPGSKGSVSLVKPIDVQVQTKKNTEGPTKEPAEWSAKEQRLASEVQVGIASVFGVDPKLVSVMIGYSY